ncbi:MAG: DUF4377 domain-containing protein [Algibacter sp.]|uniref:DUF4377 domain-containing protein n=1 Tax=Algibacter sp. TaxID=1872428 RepID=UPI0026212394|nr:DUF4377 domain-containing protein [Algibacter sp.]MDG1731081.1 DUF4377 domain-containing protein [Algibacter sp.]MDG2179588.1 DUF4377 domain-containing protein [Algibacter sp.]
MKNCTYLILSLLISLCFSCTSDDAQITELLWVDSERVNFTGVGEQTCYNIQENRSINEDEWLLFYDGIEGFDDLYEAGYIYKISH